MPLVIENGIPARETQAATDKRGRKTTASKRPHKHHQPPAVASSSSARHSRRRSRKQGLPPCDPAELAGADNADIERTDHDG
jgi:hypothetical protein